MRHPGIAGSLLLVLAVAVVGFGADRPPVPRPGVAADPATYLADVRRDLGAEWPRNHTVNVVCHGHSVPAGYAKTPVVDGRHAYPQLLLDRLREAYPHAVVNVVVTAIGGEDSEAGERRFARDVMALRPAVVTIDYALNDRRIGLERARRAWAGMIEAALRGGAKVILLTPSPDTSERSDALARHAAQVRELAKEYGVGLSDSTASFADYAARGGAVGDVMAQSNHPNAKGHELIAEPLARWFLP